jgi:hypothetical protein
MFLIAGPAIAMVGFDIAMHLALELYFWPAGIALFSASLATITVTKSLEPKS